MFDWIRADWPLKLLSLGLAVVIWAAVTGEESIRRDFDVPLDPQLGEDQVIAGELPSEVTVRLEGPASVIRKIDELELSVRPDLSDKPAGSRELHIVDEHLVGKPARASVRFFEPDRVSLVLDELVNRRVSVVPVLKGQPAPGYALYATSVRPDSVVIEGPSSQVDLVESISTEPIPLEGRTQSIIQSVDAASAQPQVRILEPGTTAYEVRVEIDVAPVARTFRTQRVSPATPAQPVAFSPATVEVVLAGPPRLIEDIDPSQVLVTATVPPLVAGAAPFRVQPSVTVDLTPELALWISVESVKPQRITARALAEERR